MKLITIQVEDNEHKFIKMKATQNDMSIKEYLLSAVTWDNLFDMGGEELQGLGITKVKGVSTKDIPHVNYLKKK